MLTYVIMAVICILCSFVLQVNMSEKIKRNGYKKVQISTLEAATSWIKHIIMHLIPYFNVIIIFMTLFISEELLIKTLVKNEKIVKIIKED